jgi:hypothetical protein
MKHLLASLTIGAWLLLPTAGVVLGAGKTLQTPTTKQPGTTAGFNCGTASAPMEPGNAAGAPGSAFNETTPGQAGTVYAGNGAASVANANSTAAVSQYDAACRQLSAQPP